MVGWLLVPRVAIRIAIGVAVGALVGNGVYAPVLLEVVLPLEGFAADLAGEGHVVLVTAFVDHQVVGLGETSLAVLANELDGALGSHLLPPAELPAVPLCLHRHYREHPYKFPPLLRCLRLCFSSLSLPFALSLCLLLSISASNSLFLPLALFICLSLSLSPSCSLYLPLTLSFSLSAPNSISFLLSLYLFFALSISATLFPQFSLSLSVSFWGSLSPRVSPSSQVRLFGLAVSLLGKSAASLFSLGSVSLSPPSLLVTPTGWLLAPGSEITLTWSCQRWIAL